MDFSTILILGQTALELGLISSLTVLALFLSYSMLNVCDLSTDGCFTLGAAVGAVVAVNGYPLLSIPVAMLAGMLSGFITAFLQTRMGINSLLAGIIVNTGLYSINLTIMGNSELPKKAGMGIAEFLKTVLTRNSAILNMNRTPTVFVKVRELLKGTPFEEQNILIVAFVAVALTVLVLSLFLKTKLGLAIRATGDNPDMVRSSSVNPIFTTTVGLCIANAFTALSGCLLAQSQKSVSIDIGTGMVTVALASLLMGTVFLKKKGVSLRAVGAVVGAIVFRIVYTIALRYDIPASMLNLVSSIIVIIAISVPYIKQQSPTIKRRLSVISGKKENRHA